MARWLYTLWRVETDNQKKVTPGRKLISATQGRRWPHSPTNQTNGTSRTRSRTATRPLAHIAFLLVTIGVSIYAVFITGAPSNVLDHDNPAQSQLAPPAAAPLATPEPPSSLSQGSAAADFPASLDLSLANSGLLSAFGSDPQSLSLPISLTGPSTTSSLAGASAADAEGSGRVCEAASSDLYCIYTIQPGDTLSAVAEEFGLRGTESLPPAEILAQSNKPAVVQSDSIVPGLKLRIPLEDGIIHTVLVSETIPDVAQRYGVPASAIENLAINNITDPDLLLIGQELLVPDPVGVFHRQSEPPPEGLQPSPEEPPQQPAGPIETPVPGDSTATPEPTATAVVATPTPASPAEEPTATQTPEEAATPTPPPLPGEDDPPSLTCNEYITVAPGPDPANPSAAGFIWPAAGPISSCFGPAHPLGMDIDLFADPNQEVAAAASGTVTFAGGNPAWSYGYYVVIDHGNGFTTLYAHLSLIGVNVGQVIEQGQTLGLGGRTGYATGNHLHFEILFNGDPIDPLPYLP